MADKHGSNLASASTSKDCSSKRRSEDDSGSGSAKKRQKPQQFKIAYTKTFPCMKASMKGEGYAFCTVCGKDISISHGGSNDISRHVGSDKHDQIVKARSASTITNFFSATSKPTASGDQSLAVTRAEVMMVELIAHHNLPLAAADTLSQGFKSMFPDSRIAADMRCGRKKATALVKALGKGRQNILSKRMQTTAFTLSTDGSNDEKSKQYPIVIRSVNQETGLVHSELFAIPICEGRSTGKNIFDVLDKELTSRNLTWENCLALGSDNANVMTGIHKGVFHYVKEKHPNVFLSGCCLHLVHIAAEKGAQCLPDVAEILSDIHSYFKKSEKRQQEFKQMQELFDTESVKMLKHAPTRWLSIGRCLERLLLNWDALKAFFRAEKEAQESSGPSLSSSKSSKDKSETQKKTETDESESQAKTYAQKKVDSILLFLKSPTNRLYMLFLNYTVKMFDPVLVGLQSEAPKVHVLRKTLLKLIKSVQSRFLKPSAMASGVPEDVDFKSAYNIKADKDLIIGESAETFIAGSDKNGLRAVRVKQFYQDVKKYFTAVCSYLVEKLPVKNPLLRHAEVADVAGQQSAQRSDLAFFLDRFPALLSPGCFRDTVMEQFAVYQYTDISGCIAERVDETWAAVSKLTDEEGETHLKELAFVMLGILTVPHSNAHCERIFSTVRKNRTDQRASLGDDTLEALLVIKAQPGHPFDSQRQHSSKTLQKLKSVYYEANKLDL